MTSFETKNLKLIPGDSEILKAAVQGNDTLAQKLNIMIQENWTEFGIGAKSKEEADKLFHGLSAGGQIEMPISDSPWSSYFGMFRDKYGIE